MSAQSPSPDLSGLMPRRGVAVRPPRGVETGTVGLLVLLTAFLIGLLAGLGPSLVDDLRLRRDAVAAPDLQLRDAQCRSWINVLQFCSATIERSGDAASGARVVRYAFFGSSGDRPTMAVRSAGGPERVGTDLGVAQVASRAVTLALFAGVLVFCIGVAAGVLRRGLAMRQAFARMGGQRLMPVVVDMERNNRLPPRRRLWVYSYDAGGRRERVMAEWPSAWQPLFTTIDESRALALQGAGGGVPMLLDAGLNGVDLNEAEKAAFREAFRTAFGEPAEKADAVSP
jgi:hypothetical protein